MAGRKYWQRGGANWGWHGTGAPPLVGGGAQGGSQMLGQVWKYHLSVRTSKIMLPSEGYPLAFEKESAISSFSLCCTPESNAVLGYE